MLFELKSVFLNDGETKEVSYQLDMKDTEIDGIFPFTSPVSVTAVAQNRASLVTLSLRCEYDYCRPCDRCMEDVRGTEVRSSSAHAARTAGDCVPNAAKTSTRATAAATKPLSIPGLRYSNSLWKIKHI